nr:hypothetical protein Iba_chr03eCG3910 [Ipomoea batatas]
MPEETLNTLSMQIELEYPEQASCKWCFFRQKGEGAKKGATKYRGHLISNECKLGDPGEWMMTAAKEWEYGSSAKIPMGKRTK